MIILAQMNTTLEEIGAKFTQEEITKIHRYINLDEQWPNRSDEHTALAGEIHDKAEEFVLELMKNGHGLCYEQQRFAGEYYLHDKLGIDRAQFFIKYPLASKH